MGERTKRVLTLCLRSGGWFGLCCSLAGVESRSTNVSCGSPGEGEAGVSMIVVWAPRVSGGAALCCGEAVAGCTRIVLGYQYAAVRSSLECALAVGVHVLARRTGYGRCAMVLRY